MTCYLSPVYGAGAQLFNNQGVILANGTIETYQAGTSTPLATFTDSTGITTNGSIITLDAYGRPPNEIWLQGGSSYKFIVKNSAGVQQGPTWDFIAGVNDTTAVTGSLAEWLPVAGTLGYINATSFSVNADVSATVTANRRLKFVCSGGTGYATVVSAVFSAGFTTVTVINDGLTLDSGLNAVSCGLINALNPSVDAGAISYKKTSTVYGTSPESLGAVTQRTDRAASLTVTGGTSTAYTLTPSPILPTYSSLSPLLVQFNSSSGANPTINVSGLGAKNLKQFDSTGAKVAASVITNQIAVLIYDGVDFIVLSSSGASAGRFLRRTLYTVNGTWTKGVDVGSIIVSGQGGGGGANNSGTGIGGGGAGGYFNKRVTSPAASYALTIGTAGANTGGDGGATTVGAICTGNGGKGSTAPGGGAGGTATGGDINIDGQPGQWGAETTPGNEYYGTGGSGFYGGGGAAGYNRATGVAGLANSGAGASGGTTTGAVGGTGWILIEEYSF